MENVRATAGRVKAVIAAGSFEQVPVLLREYGREVERAMANAANPHAAAGEALELLAGLRRLALARRAHVAARLEGLNRVGPYLQSPPRRRRLQVEG